jgi:tripeptidyl-peptidase-1
MVDGGMTFPAGGTSASAPEFAGVVSLLNDARLNAGKAPLGFLNPALYAIAAAHPGEALYDMTTGTSSCDSNGQCCGNGFAAAVGWDPTTGLGSPLFAGLAKYLV